MKKKILITLIAVCTILLAFEMIYVSAEIDGIYTYSVTDDKATITDCNESASGDVVIPATLGGYPVTTIGERAFLGCNSLLSVTIPNSVTSIGNYAFYDCRSLASITISDNISTIGNGVFEYCSNLVSVIIPDGVSSIGTFAFKSCVSLVSVTIPNSVTSIGDSAFTYCSSLKDVHYNGTKEEFNKISIGTYNKMFTSATIHYLKYRINEITIKDMSGNSLGAIPTSIFLATISFTNVSSNEDTVIILAKYTDSGAFNGLMYIQTEDVPTGSTIKLSVPVDNSKGDISKLKAFCWESFDTLIPMGNSVSFHL